MATNTSTAITIPSTNPYLDTTPAPPPSSSSSDAVNNLGRRFDSAAKKAETFAGNLYNHIRTGPGLVDIAMTRLDQAARVIADGGCKNVFRKEFGDINGEKLKDAFACYLSTTTGPVLGTLYISNKRVGFRSDNPVWTGYSQQGGPGQWVYYKVVLMADQIMAANSSSNPVRPGEKYIVVLTKDGHEFWFMAFIFYDKAFKNLNKLIQHWE
ncbi:GEM-like protein 1 [Silene latifolia]|uniref:GEM-like protein 1 n=1 Tax=Silene latifolia TaxID=37657 RepID=UPI003D76F4D4